MYTSHLEKNATYKPMNKFAEKNKVLNIIHSHPDGHYASKDDRDAIGRLKEGDRRSVSNTRFGIYDRDEKRVYYYDKDGLIKIKNLNDNGEVIYESEKYFE